MDLKDFARILGARKWLVVGCVLITTGVAFVTSYLQAPSYKGEAQILVSQQNSGTTLLGPSQAQATLSPERDVATQVNVMQSRPLVEQVIVRLGLGTTPDKLLERVNVSADGITNIVTIDVTDSSASRAADIANALADTYVAWSKGQQVSRIKTAADDVEARLATIQDQIVAIEATLPPVGAAGAQQVKLLSAKNLYSSLTVQLDQLRINEGLATGSGTILSAAVVDPVRVSPNPLRDGGLGFAVGLVFGLGMALVGGFLDTTIKSAEEAATIYAAPVLADMPAVKARDEDRSVLTLVQHPDGVAAEAYRVLRTNLSFLNIGHDLKTILVTSAAPNEGKSTLAANLAAVLAQAGHKVILVVCDFHQPASEEFFDVNHTVGLSDVLGGDEVSVALERPAGLECLSVLVSGKRPPNPSELLGSDRMRELMGSLREQADWIIMDSPPLLAVSDAAVAAQWADGVLMVTHVGVSTAEAGRKSREQLERVGARILGVVAWGLKKKSGPSHAYYGYSGYTSQ